LISETPLIGPQAIASTSLNDLTEIEDEAFPFLRLSLSGSNVELAHFKCEKSHSHSAGLGRLGFLRQLKLVRHSGELA
jgi:hypothetical protein